MDGWSEKLLVLIATLLVLTMTTRAQSGRKVTPHPSSESPLVHIETHEVVLPLNAYDADGRNVTNLSPKDLIVIEDGQPREITSLRRESASIVLVLDLANELVRFKNDTSHRYTPRGASLESRQEKPVWLPKERSDILRVPAAREFAENFISGLSDGDQIAILQYSDRVQLVQDWTADHGEAIFSLRTKYRVGLKSSYYDALVQACTKLRGRPGRRVIVMLSDGLDNASAADRQQAIEAVTRAGATVFVVEWKTVLRTAVYEDAMQMDRKELDDLSGFLKKLLEWFLGIVASGSGLADYLDWLDGIWAHGSVALHDVADNSGGEVFNPPDFEHLVSIPDSLHREIKTQFSLAFIAEHGFDNGMERRIQVIPARPGLSVRVRRTYHTDDDARQ
jgi:VWFA-related protein